MIEIVEGQWSAGETKTFHLNGEYLEVLDAAYPLTVYMMDKAGAQLSTMKNAEASFFSKPGQFQTVQIYSAQAQYIRCFIGSGDAGTRRISSTVQVVDGGLRRTMAGAAFMQVGSVNGAATCSVQLWNPAGSGRNLICRSYLIGASVSGGVGVGYSNVSGGTLVPGNRSKLLGGVNGVGEVRTSSPSIATISGQDSLYVQGVVSLYRPLLEPVVVPPGIGLTVSGGATVLGATFEWTEEAI